MTTVSLEVLVVEDNPTFLNMLCSMVAMLGHNVRGVTSGEDAIEPICSGAFQVLLTDIDLPGMSGVELAKLAVEFVPEIRILFSSGFGYLVADRLNFDFVLLHKPYFLDQLEQAIGRHAVVGSS